MRNTICLWLALACLFVLVVSQPPSDLIKSFTMLDDVIQETVWCGEDNNVILIRTGSNSVYRSDNRGQSFTRITKVMLKYAERIVDDASEIGEVTSIIKSEADSKTLLFIGNKGVFWISTSCGATMRAINKDFLISKIRMHPTEPTWIAATAVQDCKDEDDDICFYGTHTLYISKNLGASWTEAISNVKAFEWAFNAEQIFMGIPSTRLFALIRTPKQDVLYRSDDFFGNKTVLVNNCLEFKLRASYLFAITGGKGDEVNLLVSSLENKFDKFYKSVFPDIKLKMRNVHILDTSEGVVFVLSTLNPSMPYGRLYISDSTGLRYRLALKYALKDPELGADITKVEGLEGIYMINVVEEKAAKEYERSVGKSTGDDDWDEEERKERSYYWNPRQKKKPSVPNINIRNSIRTLITFNKGGSWRYLAPPKVDVKGNPIQCKGDKDCSLNLSIRVHTWFPAYSQQFAHGIIMALGSVGKTLIADYYARNVYMSRDGGLTWLEIAKGEHVYDMADHGGLLLMSRLHGNNRHQAEILYSWNEGLTWESLQITTTNATIVDIFTEPDSVSQQFLVHTEKVKEGPDKTTIKTSAIFSLNFENLHQRACVGEDRPGTSSSNYEIWTPYDGRQGQECLLGRKISYVRRKRDSECFNGIKFESPISIENCECTEEDYECDFGFIRKDLTANSPCVPVVNISYAPPAECPAGSTYMVTNGYRKVSGDSCEKGVLHDPIVIPCPTTLMSGSGVIILILLFVIVILLLGIGYTYQNFEEIRKRLQDTFNSKNSKKMKRDYLPSHKDVKYGKIEENKEMDDAEEEVIVQATAAPSEPQPALKVESEMEMK